MNIMFLLIGASLLAAMVFLFLFIWAVKSGQYDDTYTPSVRILFDDDPVSETLPEKGSGESELNKKNDQQPDEKNSN